MRARSGIARAESSLYGLTVPTIQAGLHAMLQIHAAIPSHGRIAWPSLAELTFT